VAGDEIVALDGESADHLDVVTLSRRLEGPPGSKIRLTVRHGGSDRTYTLARRRLL
jgi:C-terminal processing protease CtpA/Prc